ncbi:hypothetical protein NW759_001772 [Fusarium solani]|nr:hypothetical protein NW759_001772 [Fusarium solani]
MSTIPNIDGDARRWQPLTVDQNLCTFCQTIEFEKAVNLFEHSSASRDPKTYDDDYQFMAHFGIRSVLIANLGDSFKDKPHGPCRMCKIMLENKQQLITRLGELNKTLKMTGNDSLWALPFSAKFFGPHSIQTSTIPCKLGLEADFSVFMMVPEPYTPEDFSGRDKRAQKLSLNRDNNMPVLTVRDNRRDGSLLYNPKLVPPIFDRQLASEWLQKCKAYHDGSCCPPRNVYIEIILIDCTNCEIKTLDMSYPYIALSYRIVISRKRLQKSSEGPSDDPSQMMAVAEFNMAQYRILWCVRGDNTPEFTENLGYQDFWKHFGGLPKGRSLESFYRHIINAGSPGYSFTQG